MPRMKRTLSLLLMLCLLLTMAACGGTQTVLPAGGSASASATPAKSEEATPAASETAAPQASGPDLSERADLVFYVMGDAPTAEAEVEAAINEKLLEKFNATIDFRFSTWTDFQQKYSTELTTGGPDLIYVAGWLNYGLLANSGAFEELDTLLDAYGPELKAIIGETNLNMCRVNGDLYAIPNNWPEFVPNGVMYREDLRAKFDLPRPDSLENLEAFFLGIQKNMPEQPILRVTTSESQGLSIAFDAASTLNFKYPRVNVDGMPYGLDAKYETPSAVEDYWFSDNFVDDVRMLKRWADSGFWSKSALSDTNDSEAYINGLCVALVAGQNPNKQITAMNEIAKTHPDWITEYITFGETTGVMYPGHATQNGTAIVRGSKHPDRAMMVLNYLMSDESMNKLVQAGIEGVHYEVKDGLYQNLSEDFKYEGFNTWNLRVNDTRLMRDSDVLLQSMFDKYAEIGSKTKFPNVNIYGGFTEDYTAYQAERTAVSNVMRQYLAPLQAGLVTDVDKAVEEFRTKVTEAGLDACREGFKTQWQAYCDEYGYN